MPHSTRTKAARQRIAAHTILDPRHGGFCEESPCGFNAGDTNLFRYVGNDPTNATDPTGLEERRITMPWEGGTDGKATATAVTLTGKIGPNQPPLVDANGNYYILGKHIFNDDYPVAQGGKGEQESVRHLRYTNLKELIDGVKATIARGKPGGKLQVLELSGNANGLRFRLNNQPDSPRGEGLENTKGKRLKEDAPREGVFQLRSETVRPVAEALKELPWAKHGKLILSGCNAGTGINSWCQELADQMGGDFEVWAAGGWCSYDILTGESEISGGGLVFRGTYPPQQDKWYVFRANRPAQPAPVPPPVSGHVDDNKKVEK